MTLFRALRGRPFALLWTGQTVSRLGDSLYRVALAWWVLEKTGSAAAMGTVLIFSTVPMLLFLLVGGVVVDRLPRLRVMLTADAVSGAVVLAVAGLAYAQRLEVWHIYTASALLGLVEAFFFPAFGALVPELTPPEDLPSANSLTSLSGRLTSIAGPALGAAIVAAGGTSTAFLLDGASFAVAAGCLLPLVLRQRDAAPAARPGRRSAVRDLREGLAVVMGSAWLWVTIAIFSLVNVTLSGPVSVAMPFLVQGPLQSNVGLLGTIYSLYGVGSVLGAIGLGRLTRIRRRGLITYGTTAIAGAMAATFGLFPSVWVVGAASFVTGVCMSTFGLIWTNTVQELVPPDKLGRVTSIDYLGSFALLPIGYGLTGSATDRLGPRAVFIIGGVATIGLALAGLLHPAIRELD